MAKRNILPTGKTPPATKVSDFSWLFYGEPGVGKTTLANDFPKTLFLETESGTKAMEAAKVEITSWTDFVATVDAICEEDHDYKTIVVDTVDLLFMLCESAVCEEQGIDHVSELKWGKGWDILKLRWTKAIHKLRTARRQDGTALCVVFISHERKESIKVKRGKKEEETGRYYVSSALPNRGRTILHSAVDFIIRCELDEDGERQLRTQPANTDKYEIEAKGRGRKGAQLPDLVPMGARELLASFRKHLGAKAKE